jgi:hypothetical protein
MEFLLCGPMFALLISCSGDDKILSGPKTVSSSGGYVFAEGRWTKTDGNLSHLLAPINTVKIVCDRASMTCTELIAQVVTPDDGFSKITALYVHQHLYKVVGWSNEVVDARDELETAGDLELRIYVKDRVAHRNWRETKARGSQSSNPNNFAHWELQ